MCIPLPILSIYIWSELMTTWAKNYIMHTRFIDSHSVHTAKHYTIYGSVYIDKILLVAFIFFLYFWAIPILVYVAQLHGWMFQLRDCILWLNTAKILLNLWILECSENCLLYVYHPTYTNGDAIHNFRFKKFILNVWRTWMLKRYMQDNLIENTPFNSCIFFFLHHKDFVFLRLRSVSIILYAVV